MTPPRPPEGKHIPCGCRIVKPMFRSNLGIEVTGGDDRIEYCPLHASAPKLVAALESVVDWFDLMSKDQHEKLVEGQTLESACENWDKLIQPGLDIAPLKALLREAAK